MPSGSVLAFQPRLLFTGIYLVMGACMIALGVWQLQRADEKIQLQLLADNALAAAPLTVGQYLSTDTGENPVRVTVSGIPLWDRQLLWDNRIYQGKAGYEAIVPVRVADELPLVLVNRGWLPPGANRSSLPKIQPSSEPDRERVSSVMSIEVTGVLTRPSKGFASGDALSAAPWPRVLQYLDYAAIEQAIGEPVLAGLVEPGGQVTRPIQSASAAKSPPDNTPIWYFDNWQPVASGPERHYGYAFQWFAMFVALTVLYFSLNLRRLKDNSGL